MGYLVREILKSIQHKCFKENMGPMDPRGLGPYVNIMDVLCIIMILGKDPKPD